MAPSDLYTELIMSTTNRVFFEIFRSVYWIVYFYAAYELVGVLLDHNEKTGETHYIVYLVLALVFNHINRFSFALFKEIESDITKESNKALKKQ